MTDTSGQVMLSLGELTCSKPYIVALAPLLGTKAVLRRNLDWPFYSIWLQVVRRCAPCGEIQS
jgi:hypothetical protein